jgi:hypothetical protein
LAPEYLERKDKEGKVRREPQAYFIGPQVHLPPNVFIGLARSSYTMGVVLAGMHPLNITI